MYCPGTWCKGDHVIGLELSVPFGPIYCAAEHFFVLKIEREELRVVELIWWILIYLLWPS